MTTMTQPADRAENPERDERSLIERAQALQPRLREFAASNDEAGRINEEIIEELHNAGFFGEWVPKVLGGTELDPVSSIKVIEALTYGDASSAWVTMAVSLATGAAGAYLPDSGIAKLFGGSKFPVIAGQGTRPGKAVAVEGGFLLSGEWSFGSGLKHSAYVHTLGQVEGTKETRIFLVPVENADLKDDSWDVLGLRGTGSVDYTLDSVFVPEDLTYINTIKTPMRGGAFYGLGILQFSLLGHTGWGLGVARRMLDDLAALTASKAGRAGAIADTDMFQSEYALMEVKIRAARAFALESWTDLWNTLSQGELASQRQLTLVRLALYNITWSAQEISQFVYKSGGTTTLRAGDIQRYYRDMQAGTQHITSSPPVLQACGRELLGLAADYYWLNLQLLPRT